jgi:para-aminobenzoate synthetase / 4-amino-4-deoxychorismate lyase
MKRLSKYSIILQDHLSKTDVSWVIFSDPVAVVTTNSIDQVNKVLSDVESYLEQGFYAAGYIGYEASGGIDVSLKSHEFTEYPLIWFGIYKEHKGFDMDSVEYESFDMGEWNPNISAQQYENSIAAIKNYIRAGDTYQVNYTFRLHNSFQGNPLSLAKTIFNAQSSQYCAYINMGDIHICSASPELFFEYRNGDVTSKPMKGTVKRGLSSALDKQQKDWLHRSVKNRAENVMIVDMIRNDMSRFADAGSVKVDKLFFVEQYPTVFQMTSTVNAKTKCSAVTVVRDMFPCASITGAPKVRTMELIKQLEPDARGIYTGSIGYFSPDNNAQFNVAIRTVVINEKKQSAEYGVGGGIVWDSSAAAEFEECKLKAKILTYKEPGFEILESLLWCPKNNTVLLDLHMERLIQSAHYFNFKVDPDNVRTLILKEVIGKNSPQKIRVLLHKSGKVEISTSELVSLIGKSVGVTKRHRNTQSQYIYHKTTNRHFYDEAIREVPNVNDIIIVNDAGYVTETCIGNIIVKIDEKFITPAIDCGLLPGIYRKKLLELGVIVEGHVKLVDLKRAKEVYIINSIRGALRLREVEDDMWVITEQYAIGCEFVTFNINKMISESVS